MPEMKIAVSLAAKLGSVLVHVEEGLSAKGHVFDWHAIDGLMSDPEVTGWLEHLRGMALVPEKRDKNTA